MELLIFFVLVIIVVAVVRDQKYKRSTYYKITGKPYRRVRADSGSYGEYLIYRCLQDFEDGGAKFLFNLYLPDGRGGTSEIDAIMVCAKGIFVFESKNYSGWIFGDERQETWCQTLVSDRGSHKQFFYNPIMQNKTHIKHLKNTLSIEDLPIWSIVVFSERCTLKKMDVASKNVAVVKRNDLRKVVMGCYTQKKSVLNSETVNRIYRQLYPFTQVGEEEKKKHIAQVRYKIARKIDGQSRKKNGSKRRKNFHRG